MPFDNNSITKYINGVILIHVDFFNKSLSYNYLLFLFDRAFFYFICFLMILIELYSVIIRLIFFTLLINNELIPNSSCQS